MSLIKPFSKMRSQAGDTIVEVLIVIIVISTVIASGYSVAVTSLQTTQLAQEKAVALKIAEEQLENLKSVSAANIALMNSVNNAGAAGFCLDSTVMPTLLAGASGIPSDHQIINGGPVVANLNEAFTDYPTACHRDPFSNNCNSYCYYYGIRPLSTNEYTAVVRWPGPRGTRQQVQLTYRVYP